MELKIWIEFWDSHSLHNELHTQNSRAHSRIFNWRILNFNNSILNSKKSWGPIYKFYKSTLVGNN